MFRPHSGNAPPGWASRLVAAALTLVLVLPGMASFAADPAGADHDQVVAEAAATAAGWVAKPASVERIDAYRPAADITYRVYNAPKPLRVWIARIDLTAPGVRATVTEPHTFTGEDAQFETRCADTLQFARQRGVQLAINTSAFGPFRPRMGMPMNVVGLAATRGVVYSAPDERFGAMYLGRSGRVALKGPPLDDDDVWCVVPGFRTLVDDGKVVVTAEVARSEFGDVNPRTAVGVDRKGETLWIVVVDGRQTGVSAGITLVELASLFLSLGAWDALNLDGGGSSTFVLEDQASRHFVVNRPVGRGKPQTLRQVANNLGFYLPGTPPAVQSGADDSLRDAVIRLAASRRGGGYQWKGDGVSKDIVYAGRPYLRANPEGTFCCGATLELFLDAYCQRRLGHDSSKATGQWFEDWPWEKMTALKQGWWGTGDAPANPLFPADVRQTIREKQVCHALTWAGFGEPVSDYRLLQRGDFAMFWRKSGSGHSVVFWGRDRDEAGRERLWYWSSQPKPRYAYPLKPGGEPVKTPGYGINWESIGEDIDPARIYGVRPVEPASEVAGPTAG